MKNSFGDFFVAIIYIAFYIGIPALLVAIVWKPSLEKVQDYVKANEIGKPLYSNDPAAEICVDKNWLCHDYYIKGNSKIYQIGYGYYGFIKVSDDSIKVVTQVPQLDKCNTLK